jgi:Outer membrane protein beta-barrel domain
MKRSFTIVAACLASVTLGIAQDVPKAETFLGYTYTRFNSATNVPAFSANGGSGQFDYNFNKWLGVVADLGAVHNDNISGARLDSTFANFLFGPRVSLHYSRIKPYFQILWGGVYGTTSTQIDAITVFPAVPSQPIFIPGGGSTAPGQAVTARLVSAQTAFAMTVGGGIDIKLNKHVSFRPIGLDYYLTRLQNLRTDGDNNQNNLRYTTGFNFTFGAQ